MKTAKIKIGIICMGILAMSQLALTSVIQPITGAFPQVPVALIQMLGSLPSIGGIVAALVIGPLSGHISNRWLALDGVIMVALGGLLPLVSHSSIVFLLICAGVIGIGQSFITTMIPTMLSEYFDSDSRQKLLGLYQAVSSLGALIVSAVGGILATQTWSNVYYIYFLAVIVLIMAGVLLPKEQSATSQSDSKMPKQALSKQDKLPVNVYVIGIVSFFVTLIYTAFANNIGIYIGSAHLGNPAITGLVIAVGTVGGLLAGLSVGLLFKRLHTTMLMTALLLIGIPFIVIYFYANLVVIFVASFFAGAGMAMYQARGAFLMSNLDNPILIPKSMAIFTFGNSLGGLVSPLFFKLLGFSAGISSLLAAGGLGILIALVLAGSHFEKRTIGFDQMIGEK